MATFMGYCRMAPKKSNKTDGLSIALTPEDRKILDKAAKKADLPISIWARAELLKSARNILEAK
jgi:hypothetical protein